MNNRVLVTGASGFLGFHVVKILIEQGYKVYALVRNTSQTAELEKLGCFITKGELDSGNDVEKAVCSCDYVIHCASKTDQNSTDFEAYEKANLTSTIQLVNASKKHHIKRFIFVSSANCFTCGSRSAPGDEASGFMPLLKNSGYAYSKYLAQQYVLSEVISNNFPAVVVAPTFMLGDYDLKPSSGLLTLFILKNKFLFCPKGGKNFVDVSLVAESLVNSLVMGKIGECYLLAGENMSFKEFFLAVCEISNIKRVLLPLPAFLPYLIQVLYKIFPSKKLLLLKTNISSLLMYNYFSNAKAKRHLLMQDTDINYSLQKTIDWFIVKGHLDVK